MSEITWHSWIAGAMALLGALPMTSAHAGALTNGAIFSQFNAIIFNDFKSSSDVEGRTVVGGNLTGGGTFDTNPSGAGSSSFSALTIYGNATSGGTYNIGNVGGVAIAGSNTSSFTLQGGGSAYVGGSNSGNFTLSASGSATIGGTNSGTLQLSKGGQVYVGGSSSGGISADKSASVAINGNNSANINLNGGGTVALNGSNTGTISLNSGSLSYTGSQSGNLNLNGNATAAHVSSLTLTPPASTLVSFGTTFQTPLTALSTQLNNVAANSIATSVGGSITFKATPDSSGVAVFDITTALFAQNSKVYFILGGAKSVIVNVDSCVSVNCAFTLPSSVNFANPTDYAATVLWNFADATSLAFSNEFGGSILAPMAAVSSTSPIDGTLIAASYTGSGELHSHPYTGSFPGSTPIQVPEPASLVLLGSAMAGIAAIRRRPIGSLFQTSAVARAG